MSVYKYEDGLITERLYTRFLVLDDYREWSKFFEDKEAIQYFPWVADDSSLERSKQWVERQLTRYKEKRYGLQALFHKTTHEFIGQCGLMIQEVNGFSDIEVGYHIFKKYWGQGYAPEAAKAFLDYGFKNQQAPSFISIIDIRNIKSQRVADKNGLTREKQTKWNDLDVFIYRIDGLPSSPTNPKGSM
jgi:RimJ/RimL family protein N-acetyltransferase